MVISGSLVVAVVSLSIPGSVVEYVELIADAFRRLKTPVRMLSVLEIHNKRTIVKESNSGVTESGFLPVTIMILNGDGVDVWMLAMIFDTISFGKRRTISTD